MQASDFIDHSLDNYYNVYLLLQKYVFNISVIFSQYLFLNCCHHQIYIVINHEKVNKESNGVLYLKKKYLLMLRDLLKQLFGSYIEDYHQCTCALEKETNQNTSINDKEEIKTEVELSSSIEEDSEDSFSAFDNLYLIQYIYDNIPQYTSQSILHFPSSVKTQYPLFFDFLHVLSLMISKLYDYQKQAIQWLLYKEYIEIDQTSFSLLNHSNCISENHLVKEWIHNSTFSQHFYFNCFSLQFYTRPMNWSVGSFNSCFLLSEKEQSTFAMTSYDSLLLTHPFSSTSALFSGDKKEAYYFVEYIDYDRNINTLVNKTNSGLLAEKMGSGKTIEILVLLLLHPLYFDVSRSHS